MEYIKAVIKRQLIRDAKEIGKAVSALVVGGISYLLLDKYVGGVRQVTGPSMSPTLNRRYATFGTHYDSQNNFGLLPHLVDDLVFFSRKTAVLERGDIVLLSNPKKDSTTTLIKRVVALEGDVITPRSARGEKQEPVVVPSNCVWVESDAGPGYADSAVFGPVPRQLIQGVVRQLVSLSLLECRSLVPQLSESCQARLSPTARAEQ